MNKPHRRPARVLGRQDNLTVMHTAVTEDVYLAQACFTMRQLVLFYSRDLIKGVFWSQETNPIAELIRCESQRWMFESPKDSEVARVHLENLKQTFGERVFQAAVELVLNIKLKNVS